MRIHKAQKTSRTARVSGHCRRVFVGHSRRAPSRRERSMVGPFVERLAEKFRTSPPEVAPSALCRSITGVMPLKLPRRSPRPIAIAQRAESGQEARRQGRPALRNESKMGKSGCAPAACPICFSSLSMPWRRVGSDSDQLHQDLGHPHRGLDHGLSADRRNPWGICFSGSSSAG
jgi:hypothetical protein